MLREVLESKGFTRLFTSLSGKRLQRCLVDEVFKLKGLVQVGAPDQAAIRGAGILAFLPHLIDQSFVPDSSIRVAAHCTPLVDQCCTSTCRSSCSAGLFGFTSSAVQAESWHQEDRRHGLKRSQPHRLPPFRERSCFQQCAHPVSTSWLECHQC